MKKIIYWVILLSPLSTASITGASHIDFKLLFHQDLEPNTERNVLNALHKDKTIKKHRPKMNNNIEYSIRFSREMLENNGMRNNTIPTMNLNSLVLSALSSHLNKYSLTTEILSFNRTKNTFLPEKKNTISLELVDEGHYDPHPKYAIGLFETKKDDTPELEESINLSDDEHEVKENWLDSPRGTDNSPPPQPQTEKDSSHTLAYLTVVGLVIMAIGLQQLASKKTTQQHTNSKPQEDAETKKESV